MEDKTMQQSAAGEEQRLERLVRPVEVQELLGISEKRFYQFAKDGTLPTVRVGGSLRVREADLRRFLQSGLPLPHGQNQPIRVDMGPNTTLAGPRRRLHSVVAAPKILAPNPRATRLTKLEGGLNCWTRARIAGSASMCRTNRGDTARKVSE
jgi:excisionase family DNA binding protein